LIVYPNPVRDRLSIEGINEKTIVVLYDIAGKAVLSSTIDEKNPEIIMSDLSPGSYLLTLYQLDTKVYEQKIIKQ